MALLIVTARSPFAARLWLMSERARLSAVALKLPDDDDVAVG